MVFTKLEEDIYLNTEQGLNAVKCFEFAGISLDGYKKNMGLLFSTINGTIGAAVYTRNDVVAAPVIVSKKMDGLTNRKRAVLINSGIANSFTGKKGIIDAEKCLLKISECLEIDISECYIGSTGVVGKELDMEAILNNIEPLVKERDKKNAVDFIKATMTTDTKVKQASVNFDLNGVEVTIAACAKGSGMIMPNMATMLCTVITDACITHDLLQKALQEVTEDTFNCITVDGDTSTNDTIFFLANGAANNKIIEQQDEYAYHKFCQALKILMEHMAKQIVKDGEGITKFITIDIVNTPSRDKAKAVALSIANSPLVKTAIFGEDLNWGRIMMAIGKAMTKMNCGILDLYLNGYPIVKNGELGVTDEEFEQAKLSLKDKNVNILVDFHQGNQKVRVWTCDFSYEYIKINAEYTS